MMISSTGLIFFFGHAVLDVLLVIILFLMVRSESRRAVIDYGARLRARQRSHFPARQPHDVLIDEVHWELRELTGK
jgi:predicted LPLAT superfamily acyltransferase